MASEMQVTDVGLQWLSTRKNLLVKDFWRNLAITNNLKA